MRKLYILSHSIGFRAFEDFCDGLKDHLSKAFNTYILIYEDEAQIPEPSSNNEVYIFCGSITPKYAKLTSSHSYRHIYLINTEQSSRPLWDTIIGQYINLGVKMCDYDMYQSLYISQKYERKIPYIPYILSAKEDKYLSNLLNSCKKNYHIAICSINKSRKRSAMFEKLKSIGLKVVDVEGWKKKRDSLIAESLVLLNIHYDLEYNIFEHFRCDRWVLSGLLVVSEESKSSDCMDCKDLIIFEKYDHVIDKIVDVVNNYDIYQSQHALNLSKNKCNILQTRINLVDELVRNINA